MSCSVACADAVTVGSRGAFYDATGALRDMVPNHLFQLLALVAICCVRTWMRSWRSPWAWTETARL
mgnify:CR=1 FL=1